MWRTLTFLNFKIYCEATIITHTHTHTHTYVHIKSPAGDTEIMAIDDWLYIYIYIYISTYPVMTEYIYMCVCVCVCVCISQVDIYISTFGSNFLQALKFIDQVSCYNIFSITFVRCRKEGNRKEVTVEDAMNWGSLYPKNKIIIWSKYILCEKKY